MRLDRAVVSDLAARAIIGALFALLSINLFHEFLRTGRLTGLLLLASEALVVVLMVVRRRTELVDRSVAAALVTAVSVAGPPLLRVSIDTPLFSDAVTASLSAVGLALTIYGKVVLGRSFGIVPANRGVVVAGPYTYVRHPIYTGYLLSHLAFVLAYPTVRNVVIAVCADSALVVRALFEERMLRRDMSYQAYCARVGWHLVPGVF